MTKDLVSQQISAMRRNQKKPTRFRYVVYHSSNDVSFYDYYPTKLSAFMAAMNPRYWRCHTVILLDFDEIQS